jgi:hypothetical protein
MVSNILYRGNRQLTPPSQSTFTREDAHPNATTQLDPAPNLSNKEEAREYYTTLVREAKEQTRFFLLNKYNEIYAEFKFRVRITWAFSKGEMGYLLIGHRDPSIPVKMHEKFNKASITSIDTAENLAALIAELTQGVKDILLDLQDVHTVFYDYLLRRLRDGETDDISQDFFEYSVKKMNQHLKDQEVAWRFLDYRIQHYRTNIRVWEDELKLIDVKEYDLEAQAQLLEREKERRELFHFEMIVELRKNREAEDCKCIAEEAKRNRENLGIGTKWRNEMDRMKVSNILAYRSARELERRLVERSSLRKRERAVGRRLLELMKLRRPISRHASSILLLSGHLPLEYED